MRTEARCTIPQGLKRTLKLLTKFPTPCHQRAAWTTSSHGSEPSRPFNDTSLHVFTKLLLSRPRLLEGLCEDMQGRVVEGPRVGYGWEVPVADCLFNDALVFHKVHDGTPTPVLIAAGHSTQSFQVMLNLRHTSPLHLQRAYVNLLRASSQCAINIS